MSRDRLLMNLVRVLVEEWGVDGVQRALKSMEQSTQSVLGREAPHSEPKSSVRIKPTAFEQASRVRGQPVFRELLSEIAKQFDQKTFLPTIGDARHFLEMRGKEISPTVSRAEVFRKILDELEEMEVDELRIVAARARNSAPSQLAPLSKAIRSAGAALRPETDSEPGE
jgi:hypothetical protein